MKKINYKAQNFNGINMRLNGQHELKCTFSELIWASITVGKENFSEIFNSKVYSFYEVNYRIFMVLSYLSIDKTTNKIIKTERFNKLDASEKACISYYIGLIM